MSQSGPVQPVHSRRHRPEINQNNANEALPATRFGETEWEARDVSAYISFFFIYLLKCRYRCIHIFMNHPFKFRFHSHNVNESWRRLEHELHKWKKQ